MHLNFECKAICDNLSSAQERLQKFSPLFIGEDHQTDTYFNVPNGRMKLREGTIEHALIHYHREDAAGAKISNVILYQHQPDAALKAILTEALGIKTVVDKKRRIYFIDNVKFHFDTVKGLGTFLEIEAIDRDGDIGLEKLREQCGFYTDVLQIRPADYIAVSYSDMILEANR
jgi:predicted adenylyl cyclase CyaB